jgi:hypothetical protein
MGHIHRHDTFNVAVEENVGLIVGQEFIETKCEVEQGLSGMRRIGEKKA